MYSTAMRINHQEAAMSTGNFIAAAGRFAVHKEPVNANAAKSRERVR